MILAGQLRAYASLNMPESDTTTSGGSIDRTTIVDFSDLMTVDGLQIVSSNNSDTSSVTIYGRLASGIITSETDSLNGITPVPTTQTAWAHIMKSIKGASTLGDIAIEETTATAVGMVQSAVSNTAVLAAASLTTDGFYTGLVFRVLTGTGAGSIAKVLSYNGTTQTATFDKVLTLDSTSQYRLSRGLVFNKNPFEIITIRRPFYNAAANPGSGSIKVLYEKFFWSNDSTQNLSFAYVQEILNRFGNILFGIDPTIPSISYAANRLTPPAISSLVFGRLNQVIPTVQSVLANGQAVGVWLSFTIPAGRSPQNFSYMSGLSGQTIS
jgi:hypothetical protein